eukprot:627939_1
MEYHSEYVKCAFGGCDICISCKDITTFTIKIDHMIKIRLYFTVKIQKKENESKQKREGTNIIASQFYGRILWVWSKLCKSEPQAAEAAQRDHAYDDCKSKDKQTQDLQHKNEYVDHYNKK